MVLHDCLEIENGKKKQKKLKAWDWIHAIFQNAITRLLTVCVVRRDWLCGIVHELGKVQFGPNSSSARERGACMEGNDRVRKDRKLEKSLRSSLTTLQLYNNRVMGCVRTGSKVYRTHTRWHTQKYRHKQTRGGCDHKLPKKSVNFCWQILRNQSKQTLIY